jgi:cytidylate kinase
MSDRISIAIDGPSGAGKSSMAERFGFLYVDTGAIYRTVGLAALRAGVASRDAAGVEALLPGLIVSLTHNEKKEQRMLLNGEDVTDEIRRPEVSIYASDVSAIPAVRAFLLDMQRSLARTNDVIMDGRDIGTVVLPDAGLKVFLTAAPAARARRRYRELMDRGASVRFEDVLRDIEYRDKNDSSRTAAPLKPAADAVLIDNTELTLEQSLDELSRLVAERFAL